MPGGQDSPDTGVHQQNQADRDVYAAGQNQTVINDNRRVELAAGAVPHPAAVGLAEPVTGLPRRPVRVFEGRDEALGVLERALGARGGAVVTQAVYGLGGVGKSELALQYADAHRADYGLVWWVTAADSRQVEAGLAGLAGRLCPAAAVAGTTSDAAGWATGWLQAHDRWLLILDNVEDPADVEPLLGQLGGGHVIVTSRRDADWGRLADPVQVDVLNPGAAVQVLVLRTGKHSAADEEAAAQIAAELGFLPLALDQAAAYLDQTGMPPQEYLRLLDTRGGDLHARGHAASHPGNVVTVWSVSMDRLQATAPSAVRLLELCAWLAPEPVPLDLFTAHSGLLPEPLATAAADPVAFNDAVGTLADYSLARRAGGTLVVHRLIQDVTRHRTSGHPAATEDKSLEAILALLCADLPGDVRATPESWPRWRVLLPSVLAATGHHPGTAGEDTTAWLLSAAGIYLSSQGRSAEALPLQQRALRIREAALGPDHPDVATDLNNVGGVLSDLGRSAEALPLQQRALRIREAALGPDDPDVATDLSYVGRVLSDLGRSAEALPLQQRALRIREAALGPDHPYVAVDLNNVGRALLDLGRSAEALPLQQRALRIDEAAFGPDHPYVAADLSFVGGVLSALGRSAEALPLQQRALRIREAALGPDHPLTRQSRRYIEELESSQ